MNSLMTGINPPHPGTPDDDVSQERLEGRVAARKGVSDSENPYTGAGRQDWYLGWYDVDLKRHYE
jgi:hypothetical protein